MISQQVLLVKNVVRFQVFGAYFPSCASRLACTLCVVRWRCVPPSACAATPVVSSSNKIPRNRNRKECEVYGSNFLWKMFAAERMQHEFLWGMLLICARLLSSTMVGPAEWPESGLRFTPRIDSRKLIKHHGLLAAQFAAQSFVEGHYHATMLFFCSCSQCLRQWMTGHPTQAVDDWPGQQQWRPIWY